MQKQVVNTVQDVFVACGVAFGFSEIETVLGIILLVINIGTILWKIGYKIYLQVKQKQFDKIQQTLVDGAKELEDLTDEIKNNDKQG